MKNKQKLPTKTIKKPRKQSFVKGQDKCRHTNDHKEHGGWANPNNTQPKLLPGPSSTDTEEDTGTGQAGTQDKDLPWLGSFLGCCRSASAPAQV